MRNLNSETTLIYLEFFKIGRIVIAAGLGNVIVVDQEIVIAIYHEIRTGMDQKIKIAIIMAQGIEKDIVAVSGVVGIEIWNVVIVVAAEAGKGGASVLSHQFCCQDVENHFLDLKRLHHP